MAELSRLHAQRLECWCQTPGARISDPAAAKELIDRVGIATLYPVSPEIPNLFHAYVGDPDAKTEPQWDSPSGHVYGWRWTLGRQKAAFYGAIVRNKPTLLSWDLLPALLRLRGELRTPDELYDAGLISDNAYRVAQALEAAGGSLSTGNLRKAAEFPTGKAERAAYLKAVDELDTRMMLVKSFVPDDDDLQHELVAVRYPEHVAAAEQLSCEAALDQFLRVYLPHAVYALPTILARHLKLPEAELRAGLDRLVAVGEAHAVTFAGQKRACYVWNTARSHES